MGGGGSTAPAPTPPAPPSMGAQTRDAIEAQVEMMPQMYETQLEYAPKFSQLEYDMYSQFMPEYTRQQEAMLEELYPDIKELRDQLSVEAKGYMQDGTPEWARKQYQSDLNSQLGYNAASPVAADYKSRAMLQQGEDWRRYGHNLSNILVNRMPVQGVSAFQSSQAPITMPGADALIGAQANMYGSNVGAQASMYGSWAQHMQPQPHPAWGAAGMMGGAMLGGAKPWFLGG